MQDYSLAQIKNMQSEAAQRVREMQRRAKNKVERHNSELRGNTEPPLPPSPQKQQMSPETKKNSALPLIRPIDLKSLIGQDGDRTLLLALILILVQDGQCDEMLLLALIYIML